MNKFLFYITTVLCLLFNISNVQARRGCCSWHGGVCGCSESGRQVCCDGTLSPSCGCSISKPKVQSQRKVQDEPIIKATRSANSEYCLAWQDIYEKAAIMKGEYQNIAKIKYISQYAECEDLWQAVQSSLRFCHERGCYLQFMTVEFFWEDLNNKINNLYTYLAKNKV